MEEKRVEEIGALTLDRAVDGRERLQGPAPHLELEHRTSSCAQLPSHRAAGAERGDARVVAATPQTERQRLHAAGRTAVGEIRNEEENSRTQNSSP